MADQSAGPCVVPERWSGTDVDEIEAFLASTYEYACAELSVRALSEDTATRFHHDTLSAPSFRLTRITSHPSFGVTIGGARHTELVVVDPNELCRYTVEVCELAREAPRFTGGAPLSPDLARHWRRTVAHVRALLTAPPPAPGPVVVANAFRLLAASMLTVFPNTALDTG